MEKVGVVTDSTSRLPAELMKKYDIRVVPFHLVMDGKVYLDQIDITPDEFWKKFKTLKKLPTTGAISPGDYAEKFTELSKYTNNIVCLIISKALSATYQSAVTARQMVIQENPRLNIELVDTKTCVGALGFIVLEAARAAEAGQSLAQVVKIAEDMIPKVKYIIALDTLKYLIRGGRAPKTAIVGDLVGVKPLTGIVNGTGLMESLGRERGKKKAMLKLVDLIKEHADISKPLHVMVHYTDNIKDGEQLKEKIISTYNCAEVYITDLTPVMTTHTGPAVAISFYCG
jgi:DegV family protein with EDD domain